MERDVMASSAYEADYTQKVAFTGKGCFLPGTSIEILREPPGRGSYRHVLFDFDGTLSLIREGWPEVMIPMMVEILLETGTSESPSELEAIVRDFVMRLNGKQTIYQMIQLCEEIRKRGGTPKDPLDYKYMYLDRLMERIRDRRQALSTGRIQSEEMLVPCALDLLKALHDRGLHLYLASGTDEFYVREEARLLNLTPYFADHIYGAIDDYKSFSKAIVIQRILQENEIDGAHLLGFGDGYVEIDNIKSVGGAAVGVASDEAGRTGNPDLWKRNRLIGVGADIIIPDYRQYTALIDYLFSK